MGKSRSLSSKTGSYRYEAIVRIKRDDRCVREPEEMVQLSR